MHIDAASARAVDGGGASGARNASGNSDYYGVSVGYDARGCAWHFVSV